jgi:tetratricopeptide (TPR) repeat protein
MIELLLGAERALAAGLVDQAERLYRQAADGDPQNSIAVVGLARVALERGDEPEAWRQARRALAIDPENVAAQRLAGRLEEVWAYRGESLPDVAGGGAGPEGKPSLTAAAPDVPGETTAGQPAESAAAPSDAPTAGRPAESAAGSPDQPAPAPRHSARTRATSRRSVVDRLLRRNRQ